MKQYTNDEWINIFNEVSTGSITARQAIKKYDVSNSTYYKMKNKLLPLSPDFREALLINHNSENSNRENYIVISKNGFKIRFTPSTDVMLLKKIIGVLNDI